MLFAKRDLRDEPSRSLSQRFAQHIGRYLTASNDDHIDHTPPLEIAACYALLGYNTDKVSYDQERLIQTIHQVIGDYHAKTGYWLNQEQVAFAAIWQDAKQQAVAIQQRFKYLDIANSTLSYSDKTPTLHLALISDALKITKLCTSDNQSMKVKPSACSRTLNLPLDETNMPEIEAIGREVRGNCEKAHTQQGVDIENLQACWRLKLRYAGCNTSLMLKCMPIDMLRETFENLHLQKYGTTDKNHAIMIDELEIEVGLADDTSHEALKASVYTELWMSQWRAADDNQTGTRLKQKNPATEKQFRWLHNPILDETMAKLMPKQADSAMAGFFLTIHQKDVDEVASRN